MKEIVAVLFGLGLMVNAALFVPQAVKIFKTKSARDVSLLTFAGFNVLQAIGILHGMLQQDWSLIIGMSASFIACGAVTLLGFVYRGK
jgi:MtN3 and saliva related transmembrane protein